MNEFWELLSGWLAHDRVRALGEGAILFFLGIVLARLVAASLSRLLRAKLTAQQNLLLRRFSSYSIIGLAAVSALRAAGLDLSVFLGAAGILTVALGFASQTSASNLISGLFLLGERALVIGDVIRVATTTGEVMSIDLLSVKLRTFDNLFVRIPNETLLKSEIVNLTRYPIRRFDLPIGVAYKEDLRAVIEVLQRVASSNPICLDEPEPVIHFLAYGTSSIDLQLSTWVARESWLDLKKTLPIEIKEAFDEAGIEIPFPHLSLYSGTEMAPLPVALYKKEAPSR